MRKIRWATLALMGLSLATVAPNVFAADEAKKESKIATPADRVAVMYFHRTERCPTCKTIGSYVEEAVKQGFAKEQKNQTVGLYYIDFQQEKNAKWAKAYQVTGPTLVLAKIGDNKIVAWKPMPKVWTLVGKKDELLKYVQEGIKEYLTTKPVVDKKKSN